MTKTTLLRTLACVVGVLACVTGVASPSNAARTPVPVPSAPVSNAPDTPLLPGREVKITASLTYGASDDLGDFVSVSKLGMTLVSIYPSSEITMDECKTLTDTFWSGSAPNYHSTAEYQSGICTLTADYAYDARHAFYSLDEDGRFQARAPMEYLNQIASAFETAHFTRFEYRLTDIRNAQCNASPSYSELDKLLIDNVHMTTCVWNTEEGATIPTTDAPLVEADAEQAFYESEDGTVGPFTDLTLPVNPFTLTPTPTPTQAADDSSPASASSSPRGLIIGVGATTVLALAGLAALIWALRAKK